MSQLHVKGDSLSCFCNLKKKRTGALGPNVDVRVTEESVVTHGGEGSRDKV